MSSVPLTAMILPFVGSPQLTGGEAGPEGFEPSSTGFGDQDISSYATTPRGPQSSGPRTRTSIFAVQGRASLPDWTSPEGAKEAAGLGFEPSFPAPEAGVLPARRSRRGSLLAPEALSLAVGEVSVGAHGRLDDSRGDQDHALGGVGDVTAAGERSIGEDGVEPSPRDPKSRMRALTPRPGVGAGRGRSVPFMRRSIPYLRRARSAKSLTLIFVTIRSPRRSKRSTTGRPTRPSARSNVFS